MRDARFEIREEIKLKLAKPISENARLSTVLAGSEKRVHLVGPQRQENQEEYNLS